MEEEGGGEGGGGERFPILLPHPSPLFYLRHLLTLVPRSYLCSETARKHLLRRLSEAEVGCPNKTNNSGPFPSSKTSRQNEASATEFFL